MKPTPILIQALRNTATLLTESGANSSTYNWGSTKKCNCGLLAKEIVKLDPQANKADYNNDILGIGTWTGGYKRHTDYCDETNYKLYKIFDILERNGIEPDDYESIEYLEHDTEFHKSKNVATWMNNKANELQLELNLAR